MPDNPFDHMKSFMPPYEVKPLDLTSLQPPLSTTNPAKWTYNKLVECIKIFEKNLDNEHEVGARLVSFGAAVTFHIRDIGFYGPHIITFYGKNENGEDLQLIQHVSQLSVLLIAMNKIGDKPVRIGFKASSSSKER